MTDTIPTIANNTAVPLQRVPNLPVNTFRKPPGPVNQQQRRVSAFFAMPGVN